MSSRIGSSYSDKSKPEHVNVSSDVIAHDTAMDECTLFERKAALINARALTLTAELTHFPLAVTSSEIDKFGFGKYQ